jgi:hypothetical protein
MPDEELIRPQMFLGEALPYSTNYTQRNVRFNTVTKFNLYLAGYR